MILILRLCFGEFCALGWNFHHRGWENLIFVKFLHEIGFFCWFHDNHALFHIIVYSVHIRCLIKCLLSIFSLVWTPMSTKIWDFSCFLIKNIFGSLVVYLTHFAPHCIFHTLVMHRTLPPLAHTFATLVMCWSIPCFVVLACHVYLMLCTIFLCFRFELHFLIHFAPFMHHYHCSYLHLLPFFLLDPLSIPDKKGENIL